MQPTPYFRFDRRVIGILETAKRVIEGTAIGSTGAAWESGQFDTLTIITGFLIVCRIAVSYIIFVSVPTNPIETPATPPVGY